MPDLAKLERFVLSDRSTHSIPSPFWFTVASIARGRVVDLCAERTVRFGRDNFLVDNEQLLAGETVRVWFDAEQGRLLCCRERNYQELLLASASTKAAIARPAEVEAAPVIDTSWRDGFNPPFRWALGHKLVYSGLTERSAGNGLNRNSVQHIMLLEPYKSGRLVRRAGDMLCSAERGSYGNEAHDCHQAGEPSCKACLAFAERFMIAKPTLDPEDDRPSWTP